MLNKLEWVAKLAKIALNNFNIKKCLWCESPVVKNKNCEFCHMLDGKYDDKNGGR